jgi:hypothetical protein
MTHLIRITVHAYRMMGVRRLNKQNFEKVALQFDMQHTVVSAKNNSDCSDGIRYSDITTVLVYAMSITAMSMVAHSKFM